MKFLAIAAALLASTPALAQENANFTGVRADITAGFNDVVNAHDSNDVVYGASAGLDIPLGSRFTIGAEANTSNLFARSREIGAAARLGYAFNTRVLGYAKAGYANYNDYETVRNRTTRQNLEGLTYGGGLQFAVTPHTYLKGEYRYSNYSNSRVGQHAAVAGIGIRF